MLKKSYMGTNKIKKCQDVGLYYKKHSLHQYFLLCSRVISIKNFKLYYSLKFVSKIK